MISENTRNEQADFSNDESFHAACDGSCGCVVPCAHCKGRHRTESNDELTKERIAAPILRVG